ncbi:hypothetical protein [Roseimaritima sediminicola]|uniref:hypothetical protein n=1 Tax=Roseimaritima sediminicola TaxID=2662066 RepID=UPI001298540A|nr:hypothetical protein [Roseimaritima sediminicola]
MINEETVHRYRKDNTRPIDIGDGSTRLVRMTPRLWDDLEFLRIMEGTTTAELAAYAFEEMQLSPGESFDTCFRGIVAYLANRWVEIAEELAEEYPLDFSALHVEAGEQSSSD